MKVTKILTIAALTFVAHGVHAQVTNVEGLNVVKANATMNQSADLDMEMPLESAKKPFSYENTSESKGMEMPLASSPEKFSYSKDQVKANISKLSEKFRNNSEVKPFKLKV